MKLLLVRGLLVGVAAWMPLASATREATAWRLDDPRGSTSSLEASVSILSESGRVRVNTEAEFDTTIGISFHDGVLVCRTSTSTLAPVKSTVEFQSCWRPTDRASYARLIVRGRRGDVELNEIRCLRGVDIALHEHFPGARRSSGEFQVDGVKFALNCRPDME